MQQNRWSTKSEIQQQGLCKSHTHAESDTEKNKGEIVIRTNHQLPDILPVQLTAFLVDEGDCDPTLDTLKHTTHRIAFN